MKQCEIVFEGIPTIFYVKNQNDIIQSFHSRGLFYEARQLAFHRDVIPMNSTIIDIGANVGNHTLFYSRFASATRIYPFEPNPSAREILLLNIDANPDVRAFVDTSHAHYAIAEKPTFAEIFQPNENNLGGAKLKQIGEAVGGAVECKRLDDLKFEGSISFIKIDVEGMEIEVLAGSILTITRFRPVISIEISKRNEEAFWRWLRDNKYQVITLFHEYQHVKTYLIVPVS